MKRVLALALLTSLSSPFVSYSAFAQSPFVPGQQPPQGAPPAQPSTSTIPVITPPTSDAPVVRNGVNQNTGGNAGSNTPKASSNNGVRLNAVDAEIRDIIKQINKATGKSFIIDDKVRGKITILSEKDMSPEEAYQAFLSALEVLGYTVVMGANDVIKIVPLKDALTSPIPIYKDSTPMTDSFITRIITLKNVSALDISNAIKPLISKEGNLFALPATNTLIFTDSGTNIDRMLKIVKEMDTQGPEQRIEMITIKNASAKDIADKIQKLYIDSASAAKRPGSKTGDLDDTPFISKVIPDERTNSVIILASKRAIPKVRDLVKRLDVVLEGAQGKVHVHYLKHAEAKKMADVLAAVTSKSGGASAGASTSSGGKSITGSSGGSPVVAEFEGGVKVAADESTNSLIITSTQKDYETLVEEVISKLDIPRRQVYVEVIIMELNVDKFKDVGIGGQGGLPFTLDGNNATGFLSAFGGSAAGLGAALSGAGVAGVVSDSTVSLTTTKSDGTTSTVSVPKFGAILRAIQNDTNANILSTPNILTLDNEEAQITVGSEEPFPSGSTLSSGGNTTFNVTRQNVGITLKITPTVNEGDSVKMKIKQEVSSVKGASETVLISVGPSTTKRAVETVVVAKDQQTVVIGGLIDDKTRVEESKIPILGDIPLLGNLFKTKKTRREKTNILVFLRPYIIRDATDFLKILQKKVEERNMFIEQNFGTQQQKAIRQSIRSHAAELLEYKKDIELHQDNYQEIALPPKKKEKSSNDEVGESK